MLNNFLDKIFFLLLFLSIINIGRWLWDFYKEYRKEVPTKLIINPLDKMLIILSVAWILTIIFTGVTL